MSIFNVKRTNCSSIKVVEFTYLWEIKSFSQLLSGGKAISTHFPPGSSNNYQWRLLAYIKKKDDDISLIVTPALKTTETDWSAKCEISISDSDNEIGVTKERIENFKWEFKYSMEFPHITCLNKKNYFKNDKLNVFSKTTLFKRIEKVEMVMDASSRDLTDNLGTLLKNTMFSDAVLLCQKESFPVHKSILACRSRVFEDMFSNEMLKNTSNSITIEDISPQILKELLRYMYTGKCDMDYELAKDLIAAAEKYDLPRLKLMAANVLQEKLSTSNACDTLLIANMYSCSELSGKIVDYIRIHREEIIKTDGWNLIQENPALVNLL